ncbi:hypothetical protein AQ616_02440 [Oceanobacillus sp. E9]|uniref:hypothetical protein n=1 Tax=Oceanobacillus sp. E9 TaxID=1742575 RepID=UPI00084E9C1B|nr:hypothetical protein [Oceanobacillus sp. E9]OEH56396.1 hypothetical protein AQ616_02440 [Oceanobacillus sp. E9]
MREIRCLLDFKTIKCDYTEGFIEYLKNEFFNLYEYLNNGESINNFSLPNPQVMVILESNSELEIINNKSWDIEFVEEEKLQNSIIQRIGLRHEHEVQLYYYSKNINRAF